jgi:ABC-type polysaccharide/polyol phosphate transport system ATPase subunit
VSLADGAIRLESATRGFRLEHERARTLKELVLRRGRRAERRVWALRDVDLMIEPGEAVGMIGRNGAGKTSTLRVLAGIIPLDSGTAECGGTVVSLLELGAGFGPEFSGRENIYLSGALHGLGREAIEARLPAIIEFSELGEFIDAPVKSYSSGMFLRLGFSIVAHLQSDVMLIDEILAVGDEAFQRKCLRRVSERMAEGATLLLVSHDAAAIERVCDRVVVLDEGQVVFDGGVAEGLLHYRAMLGTLEGGGESLRRQTAATRALRIADAELLDPGGLARASFQPGEPARLRVRVEAVADAREPRLAIDLRDQRGNVLFRTETELAAPFPATLAYDIPALALTAGDFDVSIAAYDAAIAAAAPTPDRLLGFSVASHDEAQGMVNLRGTWRREDPPDLRLVEGS